MPPETQPTRAGTAGLPPGTQSLDNRTHGKPRLKRGRTWQAAMALIAVAGLAAALFAAVPLLRQADSDEGTLRGLQVRVLNISQAAAENQMDGALAALEALEKDLDDAAGQGRISLSRYRGINAAVESVRADITGRIAAVSAAVAPTTGIPDAAAAVELEKAQQPVQVEAQPPVLAPAPAPAPVQAEPVLPEPAKEAKGKGKGQGKP